MSYNGSGDMLLRWKVKTNDIQAKVAKEIIYLSRLNRYEIGSRLVVTALAEQLSVSRSPVKSALTMLEGMGVVFYEKNKGFFLAKSREELDEYAEKLEGSQQDRLYQQIADLHLAGSLPVDVGEAELMRLLGVGRSALKKCLSRILQEGWVERNAGHGWHFLPVIDSVEAYEESYYFRIVNEPAAILCPSFSPDEDELEKLLTEHSHICQHGYSYLSPQEMYDANTRLHESIMSWSNNRFMLQSLKRLNQLRRLVEYRHADKSDARRLQSSEHVEILSLIKSMNYLSAASLMKKHIERARKSKVYEGSVFPQV